MKKKQIPARKRAKKTPREREHRLEAIFAASPDYIYVTDTNGKIVDANPALLKRTGLSLEQIRQKNFLDFFAGGNRDELLQAVAKLHDGQEIHGLEVQARNAQGEVFAYEVNAVPLKTRGKVTAVLSLARDITERKRGEQVLQESERRYRVLFENANDAIVTFTLDGTISTANRATVLILGYSGEEIIGQHFRQFVTPASTALAEERTRRFLADEKLPSIFEVELVRKDRHVVLVEARTRAIRDKDGKPVSFQGIFRDVIERNQAQAALRKSEERLRVLIENASDMIMVLDANGMVCYESPSAARVLGYPLGEAIGQSGFDFIHPEDLPAAVDIFTRLAEQPGITPPREIRVRHYNGSWHVLEVTGTNLLSNPVVSGIVINSHDITDRKLAEDAVRRYAERLTVLHKIDEAILAARSPEAVAQEALRYIQQFVPYLRVSIMTFEEKSTDATVLAVLSDGETQIGVGRHIPLEAFGDITGLRQGTVHRVEDILALSRPTPLDRALRAEGVHSYISVPLIFQGTLIGSLCIGADSPGPFGPEHIAIAREVADSVAIAIQQNRLYEQIRRHAEELEERVIERTAALQESEKLAATGRMAARIAHEINNPLAGIKNSFQLLKGAVPRDHRYYGYVNRIDTEIDRIAHIVRQMFDLYQPELAQSRRFQIDEAIREVVALLEPSCRQYEIQITEELPQPPVVVRLPEGVFRQVLFNLLVNAIEASPQKGEVKVEVSVTEGEVTLAVADQGQGIPLEVKSQIFEPFFTTKEGIPRRGLGLGLSISKNLVEGMHGQLDYCSREGQGTIFQVVLPQMGQEEGEER